MTSDEIISIIFLFSIISGILFLCYIVYTKVRKRLIRRHFKDKKRQLDLNQSIIDYKKFGANKSVIILAGIIITLAILPHIIRKYKAK